MMVDNNGWYIILQPILIVIDVMVIAVRIFVKVKMMIIDIFMIQTDQKS